MGSCTSNNTVAPHSVKRIAGERTKWKADTKSCKRVASPNWEETSICQNKTDECQHLDIQEAYSIFESVRIPFRRTRLGKKAVRLDGGEIGVWVKCSSCLTWFLIYPAGYTEVVPILDGSPFASCSQVARRSARQKKLAVEARDSDSARHQSEFRPYADPSNNFKQTVRR